MFDFLIDSTYWAWSAPLIIGVFAETFISWSAPILNKNPKALLGNNLFILGMIAWLIVVFVKQGFWRGFITLVLCFVVFGIGSRIIERSFLNSVIAKHGDEARAALRDKE